MSANLLPGYMATCHWEDSIRLNTLDLSDTTSIFASSLRLSCYK